MASDLTDPLYHDRTALVTGASSGIGAAYARALAERGAQVILVARRRDRLEALAREIDAAGGSAVVIPVDLADPDAPDAIMREALARGLAIDILVNNAGYGLPGAYQSRSWADQAYFLQLMVTAYAHLTHLALPGMTERGWGRVVNVSSVAGLLPPSAGHTLYGGSKALLVSFSQALAAEMRGRGVKVSALCPGFTYTEFHDVNGTREQVNKVPKPMMLDAGKIVAGSIEALERGKTVYVPGWSYKAIVALSRVMPMGWAEALSRAQQGRFRDSGDSGKGGGPDDAGPPERRSLN